jgi:hypothetical protein
MHFDQRTQRALGEAGLSTDELRAISERIVAATQDEADRLEAFFEGLDTMYSDMEQAHSASAFPEHAVAYLDLYTHADDIRGYLRFSSWGVPVEGGRVLSADVVELSLGPTVDSRVRFAADRAALGGETADDGTTAEWGEGAGDDRDGNDDRDASEDRDAGDAAAASEPSGDADAR